GIPLEAIGQDIPFDNPSLKENLAQLYFNNGKYQAALGLLKDLENPALKEQLARKIGDSLREEGAKEPLVADAPQSGGGGAMENLRSSLEGMLESGDPQAVLERTREALDNYPMQPYFYFAHGAARSGSGNAAKALEVLSAGLDLLLDDVPLRNRIYREMARAHTLLGNPGKAKEYTNKI